MTRLSQARRIANARNGRAGHAKGTSRQWTSQEAAANASAGGKASAIARSARRREWLSYGVGL